MNLITLLELDLALDADPYNVNILSKVVRILLEDAKNRVIAEDDNE